MFKDRKENNKAGIGYYEKRKGGFLKELCVL